ncbi:MAG TPA: allantoicase [Steroidobacteraceae bacterium]|nr:allantoicase [Steroidobacteraceae bacterium]
MPAGLINLADSSLGATALWANDEFFAAKERMLNPAPPVAKPGSYDAHGQWMDGWETRRRRDPGNDACIVKLALRGAIRVLDLDTHFFTGNFPPQASVDATDDTDPLEKHARWTTIMAQSALGGDRRNRFTVSDPRPWRALRLNIYPDGGIARLRAWGVVQADWSAVKDDEVVDLFAIERGGAALLASDQHYGSIRNLNRPGRGVNMGDGWETRRRREPGADWVIVKLGHPGTIREVEVDTAHFRGNFPDRVSLQAALIADAAADALPTQSEQWPVLLPEQKLRADSLHRFAQEVAPLGPVSHVRMTIHPDGGVSRLRLFGTIARP